MENDDLFHEVLTGIREVVTEIKNSQKEVQKDINEIKLDINHHIMRTDLLEEKQDKQQEIVDQLQRDAWKVKGAMALIGFVITVLGVVALFKHN